MKSSPLPLPPLLPPASPLAEGRELKFLCLLAATVCVASPLAEGRELK